MICKISKLILLALYVGSKFKYFPGAVLLIWINFNPGMDM